MKTALVTGSAGFIGFHTAKRWLEEGWQVVGLDAFTDYYDPALKRARSDILNRFDTFTEVEARLEDPGVLMELFAEHDFWHVIHLAAQAGVRYSIDDPRSYVTSNLVGTFELLEAARAHPGARLLLASTSSVYGANPKLPYAETDRTDSPMSFYAATKKATEAMAHSYAHLYGLETIMFRFFTVYGPWGRPDMALFKFVRAILQGEAIDVYNNGDMQRDFTYIDDLIEAVWRLAHSSFAPLDDPIDSLSPAAPFRTLNIGKAHPDKLMDFITEIETALGQEARKNFLERQQGDMFETHSETALLKALTGFEAKTPIREGVPRFVDWYRSFYGV